MAEECETHTSLKVDDVWTSQDQVEAFVVCKDCDGAWELVGDLDMMTASINLSGFSELHADCDPSDYEHGSNQ